MLVSESAPQTHGAPSIEWAELEAADVLVGVAAEDGVRRAPDDDDISNALDSGLLQFSGQDGELVVNVDLRILDLNLVFSVSEDDRLLGDITRRLLEVNGNGEVHVEEVASKQVLAAGTAKVERFLIESDETLGTNQGSVS